MAATRPRAAKPRVGGSVIDTVVSTFQVFGWAGEEIEIAQREYPDHADRLWHSSTLLRPTYKLLHTEFIYRSHAREILARVVAGNDTRLGTAAECVLACYESSLRAPLNATGSGLYSRMWRRAGFPEIDADGKHHEALRGRQIDELEGKLRKRLADPSRKLPRRIEHCRGCPDWQEPAEQLTLALPPSGVQPATA